MNNTPAFDVITKNKRGDEVKLGRTWLKEKDGKYSLSFDLSSLPLGNEEVHLVSSAPINLSACPKAFYLKMPVEKGEDKKTYWHQVGRVAARPGDDKRPFSVLFDSIPTKGNLVAFDARPSKPQAERMPF